MASLVQESTSGRDYTFEEGKIMKNPNEEEGYWVGCCGTPECSMSVKDATFKVQIINKVAYLHCTKCGKIRTLEPNCRLYLSG